MDIGRASSGLAELPGPVDSARIVRGGSSGKLEITAFDTDQWSQKNTRWTTV